MGFVDKIKNALFEEVEEEIEEKEEKPKKEKVKKSGTLSVKDKLIKREKEAREREKEKPIAKKVVLDDTLDERVDYHELRDEDFDIEPLTEDVEEERKNSIPSFTVINDSDLIVDDYVEEKPLIDNVISEERKNKLEGVDVREFDYYEDNRSKPYGIDKDNDIKMHEYGAISRKDEKSIFRPSPIISPIYGILDKNYKKEDIVNKKETHITSSYERRNLSVDDVRKKAYGTVSDDLLDDMDRELEKEDKKSILQPEENLLVDLSDDDKKPELDKITMGDAEEYFEDLGLEYNVDYVDASKDTKVEEKEEIKEEKEDKKEKKVEEVKKREKDSYDEVEEVEEESNTTDDEDDNLFDLIDSMYQEKE